MNDHILTEDQIHAKLAAFIQIYRWKLKATTEHWQELEKVRDNLLLNNILRK